MPYSVHYTKRFLKELASLPANPRKKIEKIVFDELTKINVAELGYVQKMSGYKDKYKIRVGEYRIGLTIDVTDRTISVERVAHRKEIYRVFP